MSLGIDTIALLCRNFLSQANWPWWVWSGHISIFSLCFVLIVFICCYLFIFGTAGQDRLSKVARGGLFLVEAKGCDPNSTLFARVPEAVGQAIALLKSEKCINSPFLCYFVI